MYAYGPELYELQAWGATGDGGFHLDNHAQAANLLSNKLAHIHGRPALAEPAPVEQLHLPAQQLHIHQCPCQPDSTPGLHLMGPAW